MNMCIGVFVKEKKNTKIFFASYLLSFLLRTEAVTKMKCGLYTDNLPFIE